LRSFELRPDRPEAAALHDHRGHGRNAPPTVSRQWVQSAVAAQFDYLPAYTKLMWNYAPRWLGSEQMVLEFGKACAATQRYDTEVPATTYEACRALAVENANPRGVFSASPGRQRDLRNGTGLPPTLARKPGTPQAARRAQCYRCLARR